MHAIAWGTRLMGKVDAVPSKFHVATEFGHFCYLPLIPKGSWIITWEVHRGLQGAFVGKRIPLSWKSYAVAWIRVFSGGLFVWCAMATPGFLFGFLSEPSRFPAGAPIFFALVLATVAALHIGPYWIPGVGRATARRAAELERILCSAPDGDATTPPTSNARPWPPQARE